MKKLKLFLVGLLFSCFSLIQAQDYENSLQKKQLSITDTGFSDFSYTLYPNQSFVKSTLQSINQVDNTTPEGLINSILSESSLEWINLNNATVIDSLDDEELTELNTKIATDKNITFPELIQQIDFNYNGDRYIFIKYLLHNNIDSQKFPMGFYLMVNKNNVWKRVNIFDDTNSILMNYSFTLFKFNYLKLNDILDKNNNGNSLMSALINKLHTTQGFRLQLLEEELDKWSFDENNNSHIYFSENLGW
jgi:hypothetical protein